MEGNEDVPVWYTCQHSETGAGESCFKYKKDQDESNNTDSDGIKSGEESTLAELRYLSDIQYFPSWYCRPACSEETVCQNHNGCFFKYNSLRDNNYTLECPMLITEISEIGVVTNLTRKLTKTVPTRLTSFDVKLRCQYALGAEYHWTLIDTNDNVIAEVGNRPSLTYHLDRDNDLQRWRDFFARGVRFRCHARATEPLVSEQSMVVVVQGISSLDYGDERSFFCSANKSASFKWRVDGKEQPGRYNGEEKFTFLYKRPKRVFVKCEDAAGNTLARYSLLMCARDKYQQILWLTAMFLIPIAFTVFLFFDVALVYIQGEQSVVKKSLAVEDKKCEKEAALDDEKNEYNEANRNGFRISVFVLLQLLVLPLYSSISYMTDVVTDYVAFFTHVASANSQWGLATLALILCSALVTSTIFFSDSFCNEANSVTVFHRLTKTKRRRALAFVTMFCNFGPLVVQMQLFLTNWSILKTLWRKKEVTPELLHVRDQIIKLLMKLAISELVCESLGQGILQAFILSHQLGKEEICLPNASSLHWSAKGGMNTWLGAKDGFRSHAVGHQAAEATELSANLRKGRCHCDVWVARGAEHCFPESLLESHTHDQDILRKINCFIAECIAEKSTFTVILPFVQVISSIFQISFTMTHVGAVSNLPHLANLRIAARKACFYLLCLGYFLITLSVSLLFSTYLANVRNNGFFQFAALLSMLRLILPEATPARNYLPPWLIRVGSIFLPLIAHCPFYYSLYYDLVAEGAGCTVPTRNRITIRVHKDKMFARSIATYLATAEEVKETLWKQLLRMDFFPIDVGTVTTDQMQQFKFPDSTDEAVYNIRNGFNVFGHFFLWTGYLVLCNVVVTILFLCYWILVVQPHKILPNSNTQIERRAAKPIGN